MKGWSAAVLALALVAALAACPDTNGLNGQALLWETLLAPDVAHPDLGGQAALVAQLGGTNAGIGIRGAPPTATYAWQVRRGTCAAPGAVVGPAGDYPELVADSVGNASAEMRINRVLSADTTYLAEVRGAAPDTARVLCGDFQMRQ